MHELPNTVDSCSEHSPVTAWLTSEWPGSVIPLPNTYTLLVVQEHGLSVELISLLLSFYVLCVLVK
jgi:hypothetical protein